MDSFWPGQRLNDFELDAWYQVLGHHEVRHVAFALKRLAVTSEFRPSIAAIDELANAARWEENAARLMLPEPAGVPPPEDVRQFLHEKLGWEWDETGKMIFTKAPRRTAAEIAQGMAEAQAELNARKGKGKAKKK